MKLYCLVANNTVTEGPLPLSPTLSTLSALSRALARSLHLLFEQTFNFN